MGNIFKHISDVDVVKRVIGDVFEKITVSSEEPFGNMAGHAIDIEDTYTLIPYHSKCKTPTIAGDIEVDCIAWDVITYDYDEGVRYHKDGSGTPPSWDERDLITDVSFEKALMAITNDWNRVNINVGLENLYYENENIEEELNPPEMYGM